MKRYELEIWECAESWRFFSEIEAESLEQAWAIAKKDYGAGYRVRSVRQIN